MTVKDFEAEHESIPTVRRTTSDSPNGTVILTEVFIDSSKLDEWVKLATSVAHKFREMKECIFVEICVSPQDKGHVRVVHGWTKSTDWFTKNVESSVWFEDYIKNVGPLIDKSKTRVIEHFDRLISD